MNNKKNTKKTAEKSIEKVAKKVVNKSANKSIIKHFSFKRLAIFLIVAVLVVGTGFLFKTPIESYLNKNKNTFGDISTFDESGLDVHFIDVGQGDAIAIRFPDDKTMLIDAGTKKSASSLVNYLKNKFFNKNENVFDYVLLTHSDADHSGGMVDICSNFVINKIFRPYMYSKYSSDAINFDETNGDDTNKNVCPTKTYYECISAFNAEIGENGVSAKIVWTDLALLNGTEKIEGENYYFDFYAPTTNYISSSAGTIENDFSPIMVLNFNGKKIMFTGDASTSSENRAMNQFELPDVDVLKVGHHGSATSSGQNFLNKIKPEISIISSADNQYSNLPSNQTINRILNVGSIIYKTFENGTIVINITSNSTAQINVLCVGTATFMYVRVEYFMVGILIFVASICFGKKIKI